MIRTVTSRLRGDRLIFGFGARLELIRGGSFRAAEHLIGPEPLLMDKRSLLVLVKARAHVRHARAKALDPRPHLGQRPLEEIRYLVMRELGA